MSGFPEPPLHTLRRVPVLWAILILCTLIEIFLSLGDLGMFGTPGLLRAKTIWYAGFQPRLLGAAPAAYPGQTAAMFLTYSLVHGGPGHWAVNMVTLLALGTSVAAQAGQAGFLRLYLLSALGGASCYALIGPPDHPMVGASGALFGLAGALLGREIAAARAAGQSLGPAIRLLLLLVILNVVLWWGAEGRLAWQAHLGGAVVGLALAPAAHRRPPRRP